MIPFNRPHLTGKEAEYIRQALAAGKLSGNGEFTKRCQNFLEERYGFRKCLLTTSGTDALEMAALLTGVGPGDEVIVPSYTFVSTALAFIRCGAKVVFADSRDDEPNIDATKIESLVTPRTKVIVPVHYAGCACDMDAIMAIAEKHGLLVVEDAAQAVDSWYESKSEVEVEQRNFSSCAFGLQEESKPPLFDFDSRLRPPTSSNLHPSAFPHTAIKCRKRRPEPPPSRARASSHFFRVGK